MMYWFVQSWAALLSAVEKLLEASILRGYNLSRESWAVHKGHTAMDETSPPLPVEHDQDTDAADAALAISKFGVEGPYGSAFDSPKGRQPHVR